MPEQPIEPDIIQQGSGRPRVLPRLRLSRRAATAVVAGIAAGVLIAGSVVAIARPWARPPGVADPCQLLPAATVATFLPAVAAGQVVTSTSTTTNGSCTWQVGTATLLSVDVEYVSSTSQAQRIFDALPDPVGPALDGTIMPLPGIGDQAQAVLDTGFPDEVAVYVRIRAGATLFGIGFNGPRKGPSPLPGDEAVLAKLVPASRAALSRLGISVPAIPVIPARTKLTTFS